MSERKGLIRQIWEEVADTLFGAEIERRVEFAVKAIDRPKNDVSVSADGSRNLRELYPADRRELLQDALQAWRENPLAKRYVSLVGQYVAGGGLRVESDDPDANEFLQAWWAHPLNRMDTRVIDFCEELTRAGNLFPLLSTDVAGMTYLRAIPATDGKTYGVAEIETRDGDAEQPLKFVGLSTLALSDPPEWEAYDRQKDTRDEDGEYKKMMCHYAINRPVGAVWGESDLAPVAKWLKRYSDWLAQRVALNRWRNIFVWVLTGKFADETARKNREKEVNANPPAPNSILVKDESENWEVLSPELNAGEAEKDGLAVKKMVSAGLALPLHFLAEPESATRTTAEASGGPTYRFLEQRQRYFLYVIESLARIALRRRAMVDDTISGDEPIKVHGGDISARDNTALSLSASRIVAAAANLRDRELIDDKEFLRLFYKFTGESGHVDVDKLLEDGKEAGAPKVYGIGKLKVEEPGDAPVGEEGE